MRYLSVQIQPERSPGIDVERISELFQELADRDDLVLRHSFDNGQDNGAYFNFTFGTERPAELWFAMQELIFLAQEHQSHMAAASMAMCSGEAGWDQYAQLYHWNPEVPVVPATAL
ncbi:hypothetical protein [Oleiagrimonas sp. C23AA]|uniref:hypothetical protein n=1 Tax=Oleiagrimonas sp. C23AA TaxID=2719047 RepID=UPI00141E1693|nr:hypothetical protein [Oleiagrimonas sp. C23AA]NII10134.1 hypothetical protein [Oleiagrimonas sp. C23AA]